MGYYNPVLAFGLEKLGSECQKVGQGPPAALAMGMHTRP